MAAAVGDKWLINWNGRWQGQRIMLTHTYRISSVNPGVLESTIATDMINRLTSFGGGAASFQTPYLAVLPPSYTLETVVVQEYYPTRRVPLTVPITLPGTHANNTDAGNQAAAITLRTDFAGRNQVSTKHIGPIPQGVAVQLAGLITPGYKALLDAVGTQLVNTIAVVAHGLVMDPIIQHRADIATHALLRTWSTQDTLRVERRRTVGLGI